MDQKYIEDCQIMDKIITVHAGIARDPSFIKNAGVISTLKSFANFIKESISQRIEEVGVVGALSDYFLTHFLRQRFGWTGILFAIAIEVFGVNPGKILKKAYELALDTYEKKGEITEADAERIAEIATASVEKGANLSFLHQLNKQGELTSSFIKEAAPKSTAYRRLIANIKKWPVFGWLFAKAAARGQGKNLLAGFLKWLIKTILLGFAAVTIAETGKAIGKGTGITESTGGALLGGSGSQSGSEPSGSGFSWFGSESKTENTRPAPTVISTNSFPIPIGHNLQPSGHGENFFLNDESHAWQVKHNGRTVEQLLIDWAVKIYPELEGYEDVIMSTASFNKVASLLEKAKEKNPHPVYMTMPITDAFHSWREIVDLFAGQVARKINIKGTA